ncbi:hypothetical protein L1987_63434 [Smallanthus sonchifolius]|uniref:Uncharacterized protein n=1 Tax=Smallanthus sonchifolius TaxID=185202 RepID=A0ACB9CD92_9ASTR|nr:hypothetical protein L1987_63434 [Smallanthus sonchifolius]
MTTALREGGRWPRLVDSGAIGSEGSGRACKAAHKAARLSAYSIEWHGKKQEQKAPHRGERTTSWVEAAFMINLMSLTPIFHQARKQVSQTKPQDMGKQGTDSLKGPGRREEHKAKVTEAEIFRIKIKFRLKPLVELLSSASSVDSLVLVDSLVSGLAALLFPFFPFCFIRPLSLIRYKFSFHPRSIECHQIIVSRLSHCERQLLALRTNLTLEEQKARIELK